MDKRLEDMITRIFTQPISREMLEVVSRPKIKVDVLFTDSMSKDQHLLMQQLGSGDYSLLVQPSHDNDDAVTMAEYYLSGIVSAFGDFPPEDKETLTDEWVEYYHNLPDVKQSIKGLSEEFSRAVLRASILYGINQIFQGNSPEESRALNFLGTYNPLLSGAVINSFLQGNINGSMTSYASRLSTAFVDASLSVRGLVRTIDQLPDLAGRRFFGLEEEIVNIVLPLGPAYAFAKDDLLSNGSDSVSVELHPDSLQPHTYETQFMTLLKNSGVDPSGVRDREGLAEIHRDKLLPVYNANKDMLLRGTLTFVLRFHPRLRDFGDGYVSELLWSKVTSQFSSEEILGLTRPANAANIADATQGLAERRGYAFPKTEMDVGKVISEIPYASK